MQPLIWLPLHHVRNHTIVLIISNLRAAGIFFALPMQAESHVHFRSITTARKNDLTAQIFKHKVK